MRSFLLLLIFLALPAWAQQPPKLEPVPEPPPGTTPTVMDEAALAADNITIRPGEIAESYEVNGQRVVRVRQPNGRVYYLIEHQPGFGPAGTNPADSRLRVPMWVIREW